MVWEFSPPLALLAVSTAFGLVILSVGYRRRSMKGAIPIAVIGLGIASWSFTDFVMLGLTDERLNFLAARVRFVGGGITPVAMFAFALEYTGRERINRRLLPLHAFMYVVTVVLALAFPEVVYQVPRPLEFATTGPVWTVERGLGSWFGVYAVYAVGIVLTANAVLLVELLRSHRIYRKQYALLFVGQLLPTITYVLWALDAGPIPGLDLTPVAFSVTGICYVLAVFSYQLLDLTPVARHALVEEMDDGVVVVDRNERVVDTNPAFDRIADTDGAVGRPVREVWPDYETVTGGEESKTISVETDDGTRYYDVGVRDLADEQGEYAGRHVVLTDITDRRRLRERFQTLIEESSDYIMVFDADGRVQYVSPSIEYILGYDPDEMVGENVYDLVDADDRPEIREAVESLVDGTDDRARIEFRARHADGTWRVIEARGRNLLDDPVVGGVVAYCRDVTERKERERQLQRQNDQLEHFSGIVTHDLRNPLTVARGYVETARETGDLEYLDDVVQSHERMEALIEDLLSLARQGQVVDETEPTDLAEAARTAWDHVESEEATLVVDAETTLTADESRLVELFENLYRNSVEHAGPDVEIRVGETDRGFFVEDDGPGIPPDRREQVFESGFTTSENGTGYGLNIVEQIAEAHDWSVAVTDGTQGGARFEVDTRRSPRTLVEDTVAVED